jgi:hypothetical protein
MRLEYTVQFRIEPTPFTRGKCQMNFKTLMTLLFIICLAAFSLSALAKKQELPEVNEDGLHLVKGSRLAIVYAEPGADLAPYHRVMILEPYVAFKKNWQRDQRSRSAGSLRISSKDMEKIKNTLAKEFKTVFTDELKNGGYEMAEEAADDVLLIRPAIINLDVNAPDKPAAGRSTTYTSSAGEMTLYIEAYDSITGDIIAKALDRRADNRNSGFYTWTNSVTNRAAAIRILKGWADILVKALNEAKSYPADLEK